MDENRARRNELLAATVIKGLESRNMKGYYAATKEQALQKALELIPQGSSIGWGGSMHILQVDLSPTSSNAVTEDGILVNIDGNSNRVSAIAYGPRHVLMIVGMNKICRDVDAAVSRARGEAATCNAQRFPIQTPCRVTGTCADCKSPDTICCQFLTTRFSRHPGRIQVILVGEDLGF